MPIGVTARHGDALTSSNAVIINVIYFKQSFPPQRKQLIMLDIFEKRQ